MSVGSKLTTNRALHKRLHVRERRKSWGGKLFPTNSAPHSESPPLRCGVASGEKGWEQSRRGEEELGTEMGWRGVREWRKW